MDASDVAMFSDVLYPHACGDEEVHPIRGPGHLRVQDQTVGRGRLYGSARGEGLVQAHGQATEPGAVLER
jgi:hypothetical protein